MALTKHNRLTVADLRAVKGKRQLTMLFVETPEEAAAAVRGWNRHPLDHRAAMVAGHARGGGRLLRAGRPHLRPALHL